MHDYGNSGSSEQGGRYRVESSARGAEVVLMRVRIWHKLFLAILLVVALILGINLTLSQLSFQRGFSQYIEEVRLKRMDRLREVLAQHYQQHGWGGLAENPQQWRQLLMQADLLPRWRRGPPPLGRIGLLDPLRQPLIGPAAEGEGRHLLPIELDQQVVGYLSVRHFTPFRSELDERFADQQRRAFMVTALLSLLVAVVAAVLLARQFNRPIHRLADMAHQLTAGDFARRVEVKSRDELGELAADLNRLAETLQRNQRARQQWIADISHELRTPLTVLRGELEAMEDGVRPLNAQSLRSLSLEVSQLRRLVDDLYQLSLSDQGALSYQKVRLDPFALLSEVVDGFRLRMAQKPLQLQLQCAQPGVELWADPQRLTQLFTNLLENSLRYTDAPGEVRVWCEAGESLLIHIEDSAPGVPQAALSQLFERLFRVDISRNREHGGSGLGLSIVQSIAEAHGGTLQARPSTLGGLWITLQLPREYRG
jgi:two-component system sensor histidine kinase BaeS